MGVSVYSGRRWGWGDSFRLFFTVFFSGILLTVHSCAIESLAKTLRSEINAEAWATIYSTVSRPFDPPETGKIAVKIINHYGDEVLQVYEVAE